jgi:hypothetical protein
LHCKKTADIEKLWNLIVTYCNKPKCIPVNNIDNQLAATITNVENNFRTTSCEKLVSVSKGDISEKSLLLTAREKLA